MTSKITINYKIIEVAGFVFIASQPTGMISIYYSWDIGFVYWKMQIV